jgi:hypothetical protein
MACELKVAAAQMGPIHEGTRREEVVGTSPPTRAR